MPQIRTSPKTPTQATTPLLYTCAIQEHQRVFWSWVTTDQEGTILDYQYAGPLDQEATIRTAHLTAIVDGLASLPNDQAPILVRTHVTEGVDWLTDQTEPPPVFLPKVKHLRTLLAQQKIAIKSVKQAANVALPYAHKAVDEHKTEVEAYQQSLLDNRAMVIDWINDWDEFIEFTLHELLDESSEAALEMAEELDRETILWKVRELRDALSTFIEEYKR